MENNVGELIFFVLYNLNVIASSKHFLKPKLFVLKISGLECTGRAKNFREKFHPKTKVNPEISF